MKLKSVDQYQALKIAKTHLNVTNNKHFINTLISLKINLGTLLLLIG
ncbi:hypothetical protein PRUB_b0556 [Pseudoalteromonas rubra]|uniref:Uncharacterized protein n=1 Tax=Pseudoalteromonas rubra TaxID=43658 RepID=A0A8T0C152_9GAMM|nr:hypothetical protein PRUB_b0556 [Pseudoalteromonas rubra]